jgi:hypothetical protein
MEVCFTTPSRDSTGANDVGTDKRGVIVSVYGSSAMGSRPQDLKAYEDGKLGEYFN